MTQQVLSFLCARSFSATAKGLYANFLFVVSHYAFGGVGAWCGLLALGTPLRLLGRAGVSRRREGPASQPLYQGIPFAVTLPLLLGTRLLLTLRVAAGGSGWHPSSLLSQVRPHRRVLLRAGSMSTGASGRVSRARLCLFTSRLLSSLVF